MKTNLPAKEFEEREPMRKEDHEGTLGMKGSNGILTVMHNTSKKIDSGKEGLDKESERILLSLWLIRGEGPNRNEKG